MKADIIRIGNSHGVRIPKPVLEQCGLQGQVEMEVKGGRLVISPARTARQGWDSAFEKMAENGDDKLLMGDATASDWDDKEWTW